VSDTTAAEPTFPRRMSHADTLMWNMEQDPLLRSTITAVAVFDRSPGWPAFQHVMDRASRAIPRLRQRVAVPPVRLATTPAWVVDPDFDLSRHVRRVPAPPPGELRWALEQAQVRASAGFDRSRPLWDCTLVEGLAQGRAAAVATVHHSWADGVGGVALLAMMFGLESGPVAIEHPGGVPVPVPQPPAPAAPSDATVALDGLVDSARNVIHGVPEVSTRIAGHVARLGRDPRAEVVATARVLRSVARFLAPAAAPMSPLMRARSGALSYDVFDVELARLRAAAKAESGSVNDGFLAAVLLGLQHYHHRHGTAAAALRVGMPINQRGEVQALGGVRITIARFPVSLADDPAPAQLMARIGRSTRHWRAEPAIALTDELSLVLDTVPAALMRWISGGLLKQLDVIASNVPGIPVPVYCGEAELLRFYALGPPFGAAVNVTLFSHAGWCCIAVSCDRAAVPDNDVLVECLRAGFADVTVSG